MTNLDDRTWRVDLCQNCGSELGESSVRSAGAAACIAVCRRLRSLFLISSSRRQRRCRFATTSFYRMHAFGGRLDSLARARLGGSTNAIR